MLIGAVEAGGTKFVLGIGNEKGEILERLSIPTETPEITMEKVVEFFKGKEVEAIGVGCFGPIDPKLDSPTYGYITTTPKVKWANYNIIGELKKYFDVPIAFDTDVNGATLGELTWGEAKGLNSALYITVGTGIGAGAIVEGKMIHGLLHPEMGHIMVKKHEKDSYKGKCPYHGDCLEGVAAGPAIEERWGLKGDELHVNHEAWEMEAFYLAQALVNFILIVSPEKIIMGGGVMKQEQLFPLIRKEVIKQLNGYINKKEILEDIDNYIVAPKLGDNAGLCGAVALGLQLLNR
ncbi:MAG: ROK family protein [Fusobacteriaceae bacterium]|nr:ROK family protein [Fusobacteriaceae bacterium]MBP6466996.1 ROK family protein [Fusobacteriaceae bacterium]MBU9918994.1 ROK family protein [Fusobacteriaceae bacterium]